MGYSCYTDNIVSTEDAIRISEHLSIANYKAALEIVKFFQDRGEIIVNTKDHAFYVMLEMIGSIWTSGYVTGVRNERKKKKPHTTPPDQRNAV